MKFNTIQIAAFLILMFSFVTLSGMIYAQEEPDNTSLEDIIDGFEDNTDDFYDEDATYDAEEAGPADTFSWHDIDGSVRIGTCYNINHERPSPGQTDWRGFSCLESELKLELKTKFSDSWQAKVEGRVLYDSIFHFRGRDEYTKDVVDNYEKEAEILEAYIQGSITDNLDIKAGRQIIVWGRTDIIRVTDILNPIDNRELGLTEVEDLRLPVGMMRLDYYTGPWNITGIAIPEIRFNKNPEFGSDFYPYPTPPPHESTPSDGLKNAEYALALNGVFHGSDLSFYVAELYEDMPYFELRAMDLTLPVPTVTKLKHARINMYGSALNVAHGNWLIKLEAAYIDNLKGFNYPIYNSANPNQPTMSKSPKYSRTDLLFGFEYSGFTDATISLELVGRHINNYKDRKKEFMRDFSPLIASSPGFRALLNQFQEDEPEDFFQSALYMTQDLLNDTLTLTLILSAFDGTGQGGSFERLTAEYDITDALNISGGIALYQSGSYIGFEDIGKNDRLFVNFKYSF